MLSKLFSFWHSKSIQKGRKVKNSAKTGEKMEETCKREKSLIGWLNEETEWKILKTTNLRKFHDCQIRKKHSI